MKAGTAVIDILSSGLSLQFKPGQVPNHFYEEDNNNSAKKHSVFLKEKIKEWEKLGRVKRVSSAPLIVNPLSVAEKLNKETREIKLRPVLDMSRFINPRIVEHHSHLDNLDYCEPLIEPNQFMASFDLADMYHHVKLAPDQYKYFGFKLLEDDGTFQYYVFTVLMFGFSDAVYIVDQLIKPIKSFVQNLGIYFSMYIDDGKIVSNSYSSCKMHVEFVLKIVQFSGWNINWNKSVLLPTQRLKYLGVIIDTVQMKYFAPVYKLNYLDESIRNIILMYEERKFIKSVDFAALIGMITDLTKSHGNVCLACMRHCHHYLGKHVTDFGWNVKFMLDQQCLSEIKFFRNIMFKYNGNSIKNSNTAIKIFEHSEIEFFKTCIVEEEFRKNCKLFISDASDNCAFIYENDNFEIVEEFIFNEYEALSSSGLRELLAVEKALSSQPVYFQSLSNHIIYWMTDSQCCFAFLKRGSRKSQIQKVVLRIKQFEFQYNIKIIPIWSPRTSIQIQLAVLGSKFSSSTDEWSIDKISYDAILNYFNVVPTVDCFSSNSNSKCLKFFSKIPQVGTAGIDFFAQTLICSEVYWCCPPPKLIIQTIKHILSFVNVTSIVILPIWKSSNFWPFIKRGIYLARFISKYYIFQPVFSLSNACKNSIFFGKKNFSMLAILIKSNQLDNCLMVDL